MEYSTAVALREDWGEKPCDHEHLEKETYVGTYLVTWVCPHCGREFKIAEKLEMDMKRNHVANSLCC